MSSSDQIPFKTKKGTYKESSFQQMEGYQIDISGASGPSLEAGTNTKPAISSAKLGPPVERFE